MVQNTPNVEVFGFKTGGSIITFSHSKRYLITECLLIIRKLILAGVQTLVWMVVQDKSWTPDSKSYIYLLM